MHQNCSRETLKYMREREREGERDREKFIRTNTEAME